MFSDVGYCAVAFSCPTVWYFPYEGLHKRHTALFDLWHGSIENYCYNRGWVSDSQLLLFNEWSNETTWMNVHCSSTGVTKLSINRPHGTDPACRPQFGDWYSKKLLSLLSKSSSLCTSSFPGSEAKECSYRNQWEISTANCEGSRVSHIQGCQPFWIACNYVQKRSQ